MVGNGFPDKTFCEKQIKKKIKLLDIYQTAESRKLSRSSLVNVVILSKEQLFTNKTHKQLLLFSLNYLLVAIIKQNMEV